GDSSVGFSASYWQDQAQAPRRFYAATVPPSERGLSRVLQDLRGRDRYFAHHRSERRRQVAEAASIIPFSTYDPRPLRRRDAFRPLLFSARPFCRSSCLSAAEWQAPEMCPV